MFISNSQKLEGSMDASDNLMKENANKAEIIKQQ